MKSNRFGFVTSLSYENQVDELLKVNVEILATDPGALMGQFREWLNDGVSTTPVYKKEFMCLYCAVPNSVERTTCQNCGAPRSFVIG